MTWYDVGMCIFGTYIVTIFRNSILMNIDMATPSNSYYVVSPRRARFVVNLWCHFFASTFGKQMAKTSS